MRIGDYEILGELGRGGMGLVHRARAPDGRPVALKVLSPHADEKARRRFEREVQSLLRLRHPLVVQLIDAGHHDGAPWFAMELVEGESLATRIRSRGPLPPDEVAQLARQLAEALQAAHAEQIAHRDVKPENVLLSEDGRVVLSDFGLTKDFEVAESLRLSVTGAIAGTPSYWSPEQAGGEPAGLPSDVYSLGATLYAALTGSPPFSEMESFLAMVIATREREPDRPSQRGVAVPGWLEALVLAMMSKRPEERPRIDEVLAILDRERMVRQGPAKGGLGLAGLLVVLLAIAGGVVWRAAAPARVADDPLAPPPEVVEPTPTATPTLPARTPRYRSAIDLPVGGGEVRGAWRSPARVVLVSSRGRVREWRLEPEGPQVHRERTFKTRPVRRVVSMPTWQALQVVAPLEAGVWVAGPGVGLVFVPDDPDEPAFSPLPGFVPVLARRDAQGRVVLSTETEIVLYDLAARRLLLRAPWPHVERGRLLAAVHLGERILFSAQRGNREGGNVTGLQANGWLLLLEVEPRGVKLLRTRKRVAIPNLFREEDSLLVASSYGNLWRGDPELRKPGGRQALIDGELAIARRAHLGIVQDVAVCRGRLLTVAQTQRGPSLKIWDRATRKPVARWGVAEGLSPTSAPCSLAPSPDGRLVLVGTRGGLGILLPLPE